MEDRAESPAEDWLTRACRVVAVLLIGSAIAVWLQPITVPGKNLQPFGCGAPASPNDGALGKLVCTTDWDRVRLLVLALLVAGILVLAMGEVLVERLHPRGFQRGLVVGALVAVPAFVLGVVGLFTPVVLHLADGTVLRCGTPVAPSPDATMRALCGQAADTSLYGAVAVAGLAAIVVLGTGYVFAAARTAPTPTRRPRPSHGEAEVHS